VPGRFGKVHIVRYTCEQCGAEHTCEAGIHSEGMCGECGSPMRIEDLFTDRRVVSLPVSVDRRDEAA
jgi:transcription initiation factor IIE alpha subunit